MPGRSVRRRRISRSRRKRTTKKVLSGGSAKKRPKTKSVRYVNPDTGMKHHDRFSLDTTPTEAANKIMEKVGLEPVQAQNDSSYVPTKTQLLAAIAAILPYIYRFISTSETRPQPLGQTSVEDACAPIETDLLLGED